MGDFEIVSTGNDVVVNDCVRRFVEDFIKKYSLDRVESEYVVLELVRVELTTSFYKLFFLNNELNVLVRSNYNKVIVKNDRVSLDVVKKNVVLSINNNFKFFISTKKKSYLRFKTELSVLQGELMCVDGCGCYGDVIMYLVYRVVDLKYSLRKLFNYDILGLITLTTTFIKEKFYQLYLKNQVYKSEKSYCVHHIYFYDKFYSNLIMSFVLRLF